MSFVKRRQESVSLLKALLLREAFLLRFHLYALRRSAVKVRNVTYESAYQASTNTYSYTYSYLDAGGKTAPVAPFKPRSQRTIVPFWERKRRS